MTDDLLREKNMATTHKTVEGRTWIEMCYQEAWRN